MCGIEDWYKDSFLIRVGIHKGYSRTSEKYQNERKKNLNKLMQKYMIIHSTSNHTKKYLNMNVGL